jgi:hypothetical protein
METLAEFNRLAQTNRFGVRLVRGNAPPDGKGGGSNVQLEISKGSHKFINGEGKTETDTLNVAPGAMHGATYPVRFSGKIAWAFVFVPIAPVLGPRQRGVGKGPKIGLTLHELLHACGLQESDVGHKSSIKAGDIFMTDGVVDAGSKPDEDKYVFGSGKQPDALGQFTLSAQTIELVQSVWLLGQF